MSVERSALIDRKPSHSPRRWLWLAMVILLAASSFRLVALVDVPPGLAQDEVLDADIASFIRGGENALFFRHGYGHEPLYHYWAVPFQVLFGDNMLSVRLPSVYLGLLLVALTMRWAKIHFGPTAALVAGVGLSISWWPIIFSRIGIRPIMEPVLLVAAFWYWPLGVRIRARRGWRQAIAAGILLGLSIYTYTAARIIWLIPLFMLLILALRALGAGRVGGRVEETAFLRAQTGYAAVVLVVTLLVYAPMALTLRANPDLQQRLEQLGGPLMALGEGDLGPVLQEARATLGVFSLTGDPRWTYTIPDRPIFDPVTAIFFYGGLLIALWQWRKPAYLLLPVWLVVTMLPSALSPDAPSTVRLIGALPVVYLLPGLAFDQLLRRLWPTGRPLSQKASVVAVLLGSFLAVILLANGYRTLRDGFLRWPRELETRLRYQSVVQDIGRYWRQSGSAAPVVAEVFYEPIDDAGLRRSLGDDPRARWIQTGAGVAGAMVWPEGGGNSLLFVPEFAPLDPSLAALVGLSLEPDFRSERSPAFAVYRLPPWPAEKLKPIDHMFVDAQEEPLLLLLGAVLVEPESGAIRLATGWRVHNRLPGDPAIFIHLVDQNGEIVAQFDGLDAAAATLRPDDLFLQAHVLKLPDDLPEGSYRLRLGLYSRDNGQRWVTEQGNDVLELAHCQQGDGLSLLVCSLTEPP